MKILRSITIVLVVAAILATIAVAAGGRVFLPMVSNPGGAASGAYPPGPWTITDEWYDQATGITYFTLKFDGYTVYAMCIEPAVTPPPIGAQCTLNGDVFTCPGWQASRLIKVLTTPTPTPTATNTPTPTSTPTQTPTPTSTPTACYNPCPALTLRQEYPVGNVTCTKAFMQAPDMPTCALIRQYTGNDMKLSFPVAGSVSAKIYCASGTYNITDKCADGSCRIGCSDYGYSQTKCTIKIVQSINTNCGVVVCQAGAAIIDPLDDLMAPERTPEP